jgi:uncharacterized protein YjbI with pentapeptide repeats
MTLCHVMNRPLSKTIGERGLVLRLLVALSLSLAVVAVARFVRAEQAAPAAITANIEAGKSGIDAELVRAAIERELDLPVGVASGDVEAPGVLAVRVDQKRTAEVTFRTPDGRVVGRSINLPRDDTRAADTIALLAVNLVQNEAAELLAELERLRDAERARAEQAAEPEPEPAAEAIASETPPDSVPAADTLERRAYHLSVWHPLGLDPRSHLHSYNLELGLGYSRVGGISGFGLNLLFARNEGSLVGAQAAGIMNFTRGSSRGAVVSGVGNLTHGRLQGCAFAGLVNLHIAPTDMHRPLELTPRPLVTGSELDGVQMSGLWNHVSGRVRGAQVSGFGNSTVGRLEGAQLGALNLVGRELIGASFGAVNVAGSAHGIPLLAGEDSAFGVSIGARIGALNIDRLDLVGAQLGLANTAGLSVTGAQVGLVNVAHTVRGVQLGLVNVTQDMKGAAVGLVNAGRSTETRALAYASLDMPLRVGVKFVTDVMFSELSVGYDPSRTREGIENPYMLPMWFLGGHIALGEHVYLEPGAGYGYRVPAPDWHSGPQEHVASSRLVAGYRPTSSFGLFAGGGAVHIVSTSGQYRVLPDAMLGIEVF